MISKLNKWLIKIIVMLRIKDKLPKLSKHFNLSEFIDSSEHPELVGANLRALKPRDMVHLQTLVRLLEALRSYIKEPIHINSGFRYPPLNKAVKGVRNSCHTQGLAADISFGSVETLNRAYSYLSRRKSVSPKDVDELIKYPTFIHVSVPPSKLVDFEYVEI